MRIAALCAVLVLLVLSACERPFVEEQRPEVRLVRPDLSQAFVQESLEVTIDATSFRKVERVTVNGREASFDTLEQVWTATVPLDETVNALTLAAFDGEGLEGHTTAYAVRAGLHVTSGPRLPEPRGGHTATLLPDGSLLVVGGALSEGAGASDRAFLLRPGADAFETLDARLAAPRRGHTATLLPDGRVLLLGGARVGEPAGAAQLVTTAEVFDPATETFQTLLVEPAIGCERCPPPERTRHTAALVIGADQTFVDLLGGRGLFYDDVRLRGDIRRFLVEDDRLVALDVREGPRLLQAQPMDGHTQTLTTPGDPDARTLVQGAYFDGGTSVAMSFFADLAPDRSQTETSFAAPLLRPRTRHAAAPVRDGLVLITGGHRAAPSNVERTPELYVTDVEDGLPVLLPTVAETRRYGHTATFVGAGRIHQLGGFDASGRALATSHFIDLDLP